MNNSQTTIKESICVKVLWLLQKKKKKNVSHSIVSDSLRPHGS